MPLGHAPISPEGRPAKRHSPDTSAGQFCSRRSLPLCDSMTRPYFFRYGGNLLLGYDHRACTAACGKCGTRVYWSWQGSKKQPSVWRCEKCGMRNVLGRVPEWPDLPRTLYIGHEKHQQGKLYPIPPDGSNETWAQPYSIRSFVSQASSRFGGCLYESSAGGSVMGEPVFVDRCANATVDGFVEFEPCHFVAGFTIGSEKCPLWEKVAALCQTDRETRFLH